MILVDTSAWYSLLDEDDVHHDAAVARWGSLLDADVPVTHNYVVIETSALVQRRLGMDAAAQFHRALLPAADLLVITEATHVRAVDRWIAVGNRSLSLVDVASFVVMEDHAIESAFAYDSDFVAAGFATLG